MWDLLHLSGDGGIDAPEEVFQEGDLSEVGGGDVIDDRRPFFRQAIGMFGYLLQIVSILLGIRKPTFAPGIQPSL